MTTKEQIEQFKQFAERNGIENETVHDILDLCDNPGFAFDFGLINDDTEDEPHICLEIRRWPDDFSNILGRAYEIDEYIPKKHNEHYPLLRWLFGWN